MTMRGRESTPSLVSSTRGLTLSRAELERNNLEILIHSNIANTAMARMQDNTVISITARHPRRKRLTGTRTLSHQPTRSLSTVPRFAMTTAIANKSTAAFLTHPRTQPDRETSLLEEHTTKTLRHTNIARLSMPNNREGAGLKLLISKRQGKASSITIITWRQIPIDRLQVRSLLRLKNSMITSKTCT